MKTTKEMIEVMQAYLRGEQIELCHRGKWESCPTPSWNWQYVDYRVKPKFVPFEIVNEFLSAQDEHGLWTDYGEGLFINSDNTVYIDRSERGLDLVKCDFKYLLENFKFADGTPCGKEVIK